MRWRRSLVGVVMVLAVACAGPRADEGAIPDTSATAESTTTSSTTTTIPVPPDVQDLVAATTLTDLGRRVFLAASPAVEDAATFAQACGTDVTPGSPTEPRTHTQGCYVNGRIHLLAPDRAEARELLAVVAAHELLHAVYASLGPADRTRIDGETAAAAAGNERLQERLKAYGSTPTLANEMHSILGSEFEGLPPTLEAHYAQFFANRATIVAARQHTLGAREDEIKRLKADIDDLEGRIDDLRATQLELRSAGDIRTYNANVPVVNGLIGRYNADVDALNSLIDEYNGLLGG